MTFTPSIDLLYGLEAIAEAMGLTTRQAGHLQETGALPFFKLGRTVCARRSTINAYIVELEEAARRQIADHGSAAGTLGGKKVVIGLRAIAERIGASIPATSRLHAAGELPTYLDRRNRISAKVEDLAAYIERTN